MDSWNPAVGIPLILIGIVVLAVIYIGSRKTKPGQRKTTAATRIEPRLGTGEPTGADAVDDPVKAELDRLGRAVSTTARVARPVIGTRPSQGIEKIVTLYVAAPAGETLSGTDIVVAAEKAGLEFGDRGIFHRVIPGNASSGPVFSLANMVKPGSFDMARLEALRSPGLSLFMTLPGPLPALDAWDMMLPTAQRLAELLGAQVLDDGHNALGRQRVAHMRDDLREWDRRQERRRIQPGS